MRIVSQMTKRINYTVQYHDAAMPDSGSLDPLREPASQRQPGIEACRRTAPAWSGRHPNSGCVF